MKRLNTLLLTLLSPLWASGHPLAGATHTGQEVIVPKASLVKILLSRQSTGILVRDRYVPQPEVSEIAEFNGVVLNQNGYVACYVGDYWVELGHQIPQARIATLNGMVVPASVVGIDQRISLAFLRADSLREKAIPMSPEQEEDHLNLIDLERGAVRVGSCCVRTRKIRSQLPAQELSASGFELEAGSWKGSIALDTEGAFAGFVTRAQPHGFSKKLAELRFLPSRLVASSLEEVLESRGSIRAGWLGVYLEKSGNRVRVSQVVPGSPAFRAGIQKQDFILRMDQFPVGYAELVEMIRWRGAGGVSRISVESQGSVREIEVTLDSPNLKRQFSWAIRVSPQRQSPGLEQEVQVYRTVLPALLDLGLTVVELGEQLAEKLHMNHSGGLLVTEVRVGSVAAGLGFRAGDILISINGQRVLSTSDAERSLQAAENSALDIGFVRQGQTQMLRVPETR